MFTTLLAPTSGQIQLDGIDPVKDPSRARKAFGIVFQDQSLDEELTALENMEFHAVLYGVPRKERAAKIERLLKFVELWERRDEYVKNFSGGMRRRLEIARGLTHEPAILFLDEPTLGLDPQTRNHIWQYIKASVKEHGMTVFFSTHYMEEAERVAGRIIIIDNGKIVGEGTAATLRERTGAANLEDAFLALTGRVIREEGMSTQASMRMHHRMWRRTK
jgi:ABC-2 type transport system ATP-binding protein